MLKVTKQEAILKGIEKRESGTFKTDDGREIPYDGYTQVIIMVKDKNDKYVDIKCRVANTTEGRELVEKLAKLELMSKVYLDIEIQFNNSGSTAKYFIIGYSVIK